MACAPTTTSNVGEAVSIPRTQLAGEGSTDTGVDDSGGLDSDADSQSESETQPEQSPSDDDEGVDPEDPSASGSWVCHKSIRNGSEICDDAAFNVPDDGTPTALVCVTDGGGIGYVSSNTGPEMEDGVSRCQGWEDQDECAWDHLEYIEKLTCDHEGTVLQVDLSAWAGQRLWAGVHDLPEGGGHMTEVCIAMWEVQ